MPSLTFVSLIDTIPGTVHSYTHCAVISAKYCFILNVYALCYYNLSTCSSAITPEPHWEWLDTNDPLTFEYCIFFNSLHVDLWGCVLIGIHYKKKKEASLMRVEEFINLSFEKYELSLAPVAKTARRSPMGFLSDPSALSQLPKSRGTFFWKPT